MASVVTIGAGLGLAIPLWQLRKRSQQLDGLPGPASPSFLTGHTVDLRQAPTSTRWNVWQKEHGATYKLNGPLMHPILILGDPRGATHVLTTNVKNYPRTELDRIIMNQWFGPSLFTADEDQHRAMRKMLNPAFTNQSVKEVSNVFFDLTRQVTSTWQNLIGESSNATFDVKNAINIYTLDAISATMFACNISAPVPGEKSIPDLLNTFSGSEPMSTGAALAEVLVSNFPSLMKIPNPLKKAASELRSELGRIARSVWPADSAARAGEAKILELMDQRNEERMSEDECIAQIVALLFAGSESTANVLSETLYELALNPHIQDRLRTELNAAAEDRGTDQPTYDELMSGDQLPYLDAVMRESMRLKAVLMDISRTTVADDDIPLEFPLPNGQKTVHVTAGQEISIPVREGLNINPEIWGPDAEVFQPERWLAGHNSTGRRALIHAQGNVFTFGDGPRVCLGRHFAIAESKILIATLVRMYKFELAEGVEHDFYHLGGNTVKPKVRGRESEGVQLLLKVSPLM